MKIMNYKNFTVPEPSRTQNINGLISDEAKLKIFRFFRKTSSADRVFLNLQEHLICR